MLKRKLVVLLIALIGVTPMMAQKFSKKEQARREAREANFFHGASFTLTGGVVHSWLQKSEIDPATTSFDKTEFWGQYDNSFNLGFLWDQAITRRWGIQTGLYYSRKGGDHLYYRDQHLGYGPILLAEETQEYSNQSVELQLQGRLFLPLTKRSRFSLNAGGYIDRVVESGDGFGKWDMGIQGGLTYEWYHLSLGATYQRSLFTPYIDNSNTKQQAVYVNIGYRFWKK